jgi:hypothetical protein
MKRITKRRFNALSQTFCSKGIISEEKAATMSQEDKKFMCKQFEHMNAPILAALIPDDPEFMSWLYAMGYGYNYTNQKGLHFNGTCAHYLKYGRPVIDDPRYSSTISKP